MHTTGPTCVTICSCVVIREKKKKKKKVISFSFGYTKNVKQLTCKLSAKIHKKLDII